MAKANQKSLLASIVSLLLGLLTLALLGGLFVDWIAAGNAHWKASSEAAALSASQAYLRVLTKFEEH